MKKMKLNLAVLTTLMLTACSGGGSSYHSKTEHHSYVAEHKSVTTSVSSNVLTKQKSSVKTIPTELKKPVTPQRNEINNQPKGEMAEKVSDQTVFGRLATYPQEVYNTNCKYCTNYSNAHLVQIKLEGREITVMPMRESLNQTHKIQTLRDDNGNLFGYYGGVRLSELVQSVAHPSEKELMYYYLPLLDFDKTNQSVQPSQNMSYNGKMYYTKVKTLANVLEATVTARYNHTNKNISMEIQNEEMDLELISNKFKPREPVTVQQGQQNNVFGLLYDKNQKQVVGQFDGGIYGASGEILVGKTQSNNIGASTQGREDWIGVVGAKGKPN